MGPRREAHNLCNILARRPSKGLALAVRVGSEGRTVHEELIGRIEMTKRIVVIGGVAAGPKAAARARRLDPEAEITILEKGPQASYGACGFPYFIGGRVHRIQELMETASGAVRGPNFFDKTKDIRLLTGAEAMEIRRDAREVLYRDPATGGAASLAYDKLVIATGAKPVNPPIPGLDLDNVFALKTYEDAQRFREALDQIDDYLKQKDIGDLRQARPLRAVLVGAGLIGMEVAEALLERGAEVTMVEMLPQVMPPLDPEISAHLEKYATAKGLRVLTGARVEALSGEPGGGVQSVRLSTGEVPADLVLVATGVRPEVDLARRAGLAIGPTGAIQVDAYLRTSDPDIYAAGDCAEKRHAVTGKPCWLALGSTANKEGRVAGTNAIRGDTETFGGVAGALVMRFFDLTVARMGLNEREARAEGLDVETALLAGPDKPHFMEGAKPVLVKVVAERGTRRLLGVQGVGLGDVARRVDAAAAPVMAGMTVDQVANLDLLYAPPYAPPMDVLITAANMLRNKLDGVAQGLHPAEYRALVERGAAPLMIDVRSPAEHQALPFDGAKLIPLGALRERAAEVPRDRPVVLLCKIGLRGYEAQRILQGKGHDNARFLEGGVVGWPYPG